MEHEDKWWFPLVAAVVALFYILPVFWWVSAKEEWLMITCKKPYPKDYDHDWYL
jgi:hypothetical protein